MINKKKKKRKKNAIQTLAGFQIHHRKAGR